MPPTLASLLEVIGKAGRDPLAALHTPYGSPLVSPPVYIETDRPGLTYGCNNVEGRRGTHEVDQAGTQVGRRRSRSAWA